MSIFWFHEVHFLRVACLIGECTKTRNPGIGAVLHWRCPHLHIFYTNPCLIVMVNTSWFIQWIYFLEVLTKEYSTGFKSLLLRNRKCVF